MTEKINSIDDFVKKSRHVQNDVTYSVVDQQENEFIISRTKGRNERLLAVLPKHNMFYIQDGTKRPLTKANLKNFLPALPKEGIELNQVKWLPYLDATSIDDIMTLVEKPHIIDICMCGISPQIACDTTYIRLWKNYPKLVKALSEKAGYICNETHFEGILGEVAASFNQSEAIYFWDCVNSLDCANLEGYCTYLLTRLFNYIAREYSFMLDHKLLDYLFHNLYHQGFQAIDGDILGIYQNVLEMQVKYLGGIVTPYPNNLMLKYQELKKKEREVIHDKMENSYQKAIPRLEKLAFETENGDTIKPILSYKELCEKMKALGIKSKTLLEDTSYFGVILKCHGHSPKLIGIQLESRHLLSDNVTVRERYVLEQWQTDRSYIAKAA